MVRPESLLTGRTAERTIVLLSQTGKESHDNEVPTVAPSRRSLPSNRVRTRPPLLRIGITVLACTPALFGQGPPRATPTVDQPALRIDLASLGYAQLARSERLSREEANVSLDFVDAQHLLLTFDRRKLFARLPECPRTHSDRMMHAAILELPSGKIVKEADWYLHDRQRYLWPLGNGRFLLRKLNSLYLVTRALQEQLLLDSPKDLEWLTVSADGKQAILETRNPGSGPKEAASEGATPPEKTASKFSLDFFDIDSRTSKQTIESNSVVHLNAAGTGYADVLRKGDLWLVRFGPTTSQRKNIARVRSRCTPDVFYSSKNSILIGRCPANPAEYSVTSFTVTGRRLWRQHWKAKRFSPEVIHSDDNRRFAVTSFSVPDAPQATAAISEEETDADAGPQQNIQILETASGDPVQTLIATPSVVSAQNFSLSPDGMHFALLHNSQIDLYDLPKVSDEEQARFTALQADVPGLYIVSKSGSETNDEDADADAADVDSAPAAPDSSLPSNNTTPGAILSQTNISPTPPAGKEIQTHPVPTFRASAQAVTLDVVVTDAKGHPIKGLRQQDFQLQEDGKPQNLHYFNEFALAQTAPEGPPPPKPSPNVFTNITNAPDAGSVVLILLDQLNTPASDQQFARKQLIKFLKTRASPCAVCSMHLEP